MRLMQMIDAKVNRILSEMGVSTDDIEVLQRNPGRLTLRAAITGRPVVVKLKAYSCLRGLLYLYRGETPLMSEWRIMNDLVESSVAVPRPVEFKRLPRRGSWCCFRDALIMDYVKGRLTAGNHARALLTARRIDELSLLEDEIINLTIQLVTAGYYDTDHSPHNMLLDDSILYRFDFGLARKTPRPWHPVEEYGEMLGHLIAMYTFALQPDVERIPIFATKLLEKMSPPDAVWQFAREFFQYRMDKQRREIGINTVVELPERL